MANCPNKNLTEYKVLQSVYKSELKTNNIINSWQKANSSESFPTVKEAAKFVKNNKVSYSLEQKNFKDALVQNLIKKKLIHRYKGQLYVNGSYDNAWVLDEELIGKNEKKIRSYLSINNIPNELVDIEKSKISIAKRFSFSNKVLEPKDIIAESRSWDKPRSRATVLHLKRLYPKLDIKMVTMSEAIALHRTVSKSNKKSGDLNNMNSFYRDGVVYLIEGKINDDTVVEEMLHPFVDAIKLDNEPLFDKLYAEARLNFPSLHQSIQEAYSDKQGFDNLDRKIELVTQSLTRHFNKEFTNDKPSRTFLNLVKESLEWFMSVIDDFHKYLTGVPIPVSAINSNTTFTDIAKLLNTENINFDINIGYTGKIRYSLSPEKKIIVDRVLEVSNGIQKEVINKMLHLAQAAEGVVDDITVSALNPDGTLNEDSMAPIIVLDKKSHIYTDIKTNTVYTSATTAIKGKLTNKEGDAIKARDKAIEGLKGKDLTDVKKEWTKKIKEGKVADALFQEGKQFNLDIGNDIDIIAESVVFELNGTDKPNMVEDTFNKMKILTRDQTVEFFGAMRVVIGDLMPENSVALSQVVVFDEATKIAGTADLVIIDRNGAINILDLKTSKNSIHEKASVTTAAGRSGKSVYESSEWTLSSDSLLKQKGVNRLSTKGQHNLQVNLYRRMFENMGYTVNTGDFSASTFHFKLNIKGKGKDQKYSGTYEHEKNQHHNNELTETKPSENGIYVDMLIPSTLVNKNKEDLDKKLAKLDDSIYEGSKDEQANKNSEEELDNIEESVKAEEAQPLSVIFDAIESYNVSVQEAQKGDLRNTNKVFSKKTFNQRREARSKELAYIHAGLNKGPKAQSVVYTGLLSNALKSVREFTNYVSDSKNLSDPSYISYVLNFDRFLATYIPLYSIANSAELNATQKKLVLNLQLEVNKLTGGATLKSGTEGLVNTAIFDYVKEVVNETSNRGYGEKGSGFSEEDLILDLTRIADTSSINLNTGDLATSKDPLLAAVDKIYKRQKQVLLDKIGLREKVIRSQANKLLKLTPGHNKNTMYDYMITRDSNGKRDGGYVKAIGQKYTEMKEGFKKSVSDSKGVPFVYRDVTNRDDASKEDIEFNKDLAAKKRLRSEFMRAERSDENGNRIDGKYHHYNKEFLKERSKYERWSSSNGYGKWVRKRNIDDVEYRIFESKYFNEVSYDRPLTDGNGNFTGSVAKADNDKFRFVKSELKEANYFALDKEGYPEKTGDMRSEQYKAIFDPNKTDALSIAQREFYELYIQYYENELLVKLNDHTRHQMLGKNPLVKNDLLTNIKDRPSVFARAYSSTVRSVKNFVTETSTQKTVLLDENGNFTNKMPVYFIGSPRVEGALEETEKELKELEHKYRTNKINRVSYLKDKDALDGSIAKLRMKPTVDEISTDLGASLIKFSAMAEHYETMNEIEDTLTAITRVVENREYTPSDGKSSFVGRLVDGTKKAVGFTRDTAGDSNSVRRVRKYLSMVYYDNETTTKGVVDKMADLLISQSSLAYVAFNPFGNFNNYLMGRINNNIEMLGSRFYSKKSYLRASKEWNVNGLQSIIKRTGTGIQEAADVATLGLLGVGKNDYDPDYANNKYEAFVDLFRMMDLHTDIRESGRSLDEASIWERFKAFGYVLQDAAEYNVQSKVGMAMIMDTQIKNLISGETMSLYDAFQYNAVKHENELIAGFTHIVNKNGTEVEYNDKFRYDLRNNIREVNKQIHGNYAHEDRMIIQNYVIGKFATQFKKWVAPAIKARFRTEYFDENLGWMEGRYKSAWKFAAFVKQQIFNGNRDLNKLSKLYMEEYGDGLGGNIDQKAKNQIQGYFRTVGEAGIILTSLLVGTLLDSLLAGDDDDTGTERRLKNLVKYQSDRLTKELITFVPVVGSRETFQLIKSPIASAKMMSDWANVLKLTITSPAAYIILGEEGFKANSTYVYQNAPKAGIIKVGAAWNGALPILNQIRKYDNLIKEQDYNY